MRLRITIIISLICAVFYLYITQRADFSEKFENVEKKKGDFIFGYYALPERFFEEYGRLPKDINEIKDLIKVMCEGDDIDTMTRFFLLDELSDDSLYIHYLPIYQRNTGIIKSCVYLSAGIDGKIDNILNPTDTLYTDDWFLKLKTYNADKILADKHPDGVINIVKYYPSDYFSIWDRFFGNKDYVLILVTIN